ncbi:MAG: tetratricopeptide repeat protein [Thermoplasmata archaeon]|nr:tetratricopeptide repeat protein [Thermoplasmata archaeon]
MAKRRRRGKPKQEPCPVCGAKVKDIAKHLQRKHPEEAEQMKIEALNEITARLKPSDDEKLDIAIRLFEEKDFVLVPEILKDISPTFEDLAGVFHSVATAQNELDNYNEAEHYINRALALSPDNPELRFNRALMYSKNNKMYAAYEDLAKIDISKAELNNRDMIQKFKNYLNNEIESRSHELNLSKSKFIESYRAFIEGYDLMCAGKYHECIETFEKVLASDPNSYQSYGNIGIAYMKLGDRKNAREYFEHALSINPDYAHTKNNLKVLKDHEKGEQSGLGVSLELLTAEELKMVPKTELVGKKLESIMASTAFYRVKNPGKVREVLKDYNEFKIEDEGKYFIDAIWSRENPHHPLMEMLTLDASEPYSILGDITLRWDDLKLSAQSRGRLRVLQNILLEKCELQDELEFIDEYYEDIVGPAVWGADEGTESRKNSEKSRRRSSKKSTKKG